MKRVPLAAVLAFMGLLSVSSCVVRERTVAHPGGCPGGYWVEGHRGYYGEWHHREWRCPNRAWR